MKERPSLKKMLEGMDDPILPKSSDTSYQAISLKSMFLDDVDEYNTVVHAHPKSAHRNIVSSDGLGNGMIFTGPSPKNSIYGDEIYLKALELIASLIHELGKVFPEMIPKGTQA